ncbi:unnamed protein product [Effrenium voratum]|nr:unnamed protein product [Effrenium voratum]
MTVEALPCGDGWAGEFLGAAARFALELRAKERSDDCIVPTLGMCEDGKEPAAAAAAAAAPGWAGKFLQAEGAARELSFNQYCEHCTFLETGASGMEICEGGSERALTVENLPDFVECAAQWWLRDGIMSQVEAFRLGVEDVCDSPAIWAFEAQELKELFCGAAAPNWTEEDLKQHLKFRGGYTAASPVVQLLIQELVRFSPEHKSQFLEFVTACPRLPHGGLAAAEIAVVAQPKGKLPRAHTCTNELQLPSYDSVEELSAKLFEAMGSARGMYE